MLENGADPNVNDTDTIIPSPLMIAIANEDRELVSLMIKNNVNVNFKGNWGSLSPLEWAVSYNEDATIVLLLVEAGAKVQNTKNDGQLDPLQICIRNGYFEKFFIIVQNTKESFNLQAIYDTGETLLTLGTILPSSSTEADNILHLYTYLVLNRVPFETQNANALSSAINYGNINVIKFLIESGARININPSLFISAISYSKHAITEYIHDFSLNNEFIAKKNESLELLIELGLDVNLTNIYLTECNTFFSPLGYALWIKANSAAEILLKYGAEIELKDLDGQTPLTRAILANNYEGVKLLLKLGADIFKRNNDNLLPIEIALSLNHTEIFNLLIESEVMHFQESR